MELKTGCKQTAVGVVPEDWSITPLAGLVAILHGFGFESRYFRSAGKYRLTTPGHFHETGGFRDIGNKQKFYEGPLPDDYLLSGGDLIVAMTEQADGLLGSAAFVPTSAIYLHNQRIGRAKILSSELSSSFLYRVFNSTAYRAKVRETAAGTKVKHTSPSRLLEIPVALPPTKAEQESIAEALSDADALIESLEQLIVKKRHIKQGAMQELLRPKATWQTTSIEKISDPTRRWSFTGGPFGSNLKSSDYTNEGVRIIQLQNIGDGEFKDEYEIYTSPQKADELLSCNVYPDEIILSKMGDPVARACIVPKHRDRYLMCSDGIRLAVDQKKFNTYFVYIVINAPAFRTKAANAGTGSTRKRIGLTELRILEMPCPCLSEQNAIAGILSDMEGEISTLEAKVAKARHLKHGMMQELLTGRVRLV